MAETETTTPKPGHNGMDTASLVNSVARIENLYDELDTEHSAYMLRCQRIRGDMKQVYDEAKDAGIPKKALKSVIKTRQLQAKLEAIREDLEADVQDDYDTIRHALGDLADTPLGASVLPVVPDEDAAPTPMPETATAPEQA